MISLRSLPLDDVRPKTGRLFRIESRKSTRSHKISSHTTACDSLDQILPTVAGVTMMALSPTPYGKHLSVRWLLLSEAPDPEFHSAAEAAKSFHGASQDSGTFTSQITGCSSFAAVTIKDFADESVGHIYTVCPRGCCRSVESETRWLENPELVFCVVGHSVRSPWRRQCYGDRRFIDVVQSL